LKQDARAAGADIIDFGMGNPDQPPAQYIIDKMIETVKKPKVHGYSSSKGIKGLLKAQVDYYQRRFGVTLDPETEVIATLGSKEGFANMAQAITAPGDVVLVPNPTYPIHSFGFLISGAALRHISAKPDETMLRDIDQAIRHSIPKPSVLVLNFPSNPTAYVADMDFYVEVVKLCKQHGIYILSDLAYAELYYDGKPTISILEVEGARDIAVEFTSMSKTFLMAGWRMGFAVGNKRLIAALTRVKSYLDYGAFTPVQVAAATAINGPDNQGSEKYISEVRNLYKNRRDVLVDSFTRAGWVFEPTKATMFSWVKIPEKYTHLGSLKFSKLLLEKADVAVAPGIGFGEFGEGYIRIGMVENRQRIKQAAKNIKKMFSEN
ncbi:MAG: LL-diaminopimelate aminotransferase, partial [Rhizobiales bacterium]|nr:LL-diaminopimelate aminotransferase [Hyphomicrobiales bacterium]